MIAWGLISLRCRDTPGGERGGLRRAVLTAPARPGRTRLKLSSVELPTSNFPAWASGGPGLTSSGQNLFEADMNEVRHPDLYSTRWLHSEFHS
eukprot:4018666-Pyramimonas_sp.AAC.1